ncbi:MAG TPA: BatD family protein [Steroidobacteraceae bacterium]|jgi:hypothetical protein
MARIIFNPWLIAVIGIYFAMDTGALADAPLVYATIEPAQITLGESAVYTLTNMGDSTDNVALPAVSGLRFEIVGRRRQIEFINGITVPSSATIIRVTPQVAGIFTIPGVTPKSQPLVLQVNTTPSSANAPRASGGVTPYRAPILSGATMPKGIRLTEDGSAFMRLEVPKRELYVGERVPIDIQLGMRSGFVQHLDGLPRFTGDDFTLNLTNSPDRSEESLDGQPFVLLTWHSEITVVKPGSFSFSAEMPITVRIRTRSRRDSILDDQFGDPFLQNIFGATVPKDINVTSPPAELKVLALPTEGRPPDFHGAIGTFSIESDVSPATADAGDPLTLRMRVTGSGNFDRVDSLMLEHIDQWKTYPPKSSFRPSDPTSHKGEKIFEQPLIALRPGVQTLPALTFTYFDPNTRRYETARTPPLSVKISPSLADATAVTDGKVASTVADPYGGALRPDHAIGQTMMESLTPLYLQKRFLAVPSLLAILFAGGWFAARLRKAPNRKTKKSDRAATRAAKRALTGMEAAARNGDVGSFFELALSAVREVLAVKWQLAPDQVTTAEVLNRTGQEGQELTQLFALADESKYSGHKQGKTDFGRWMRVVREQLLARNAA